MTSIQGRQGVQLQTSRNMACSVAGAGLQAAPRSIRASAGQRCISAALRAPLVGGRAAAPGRRRRLVVPRAQQQEDLAVVEITEEQAERIAAGKAVAAATNRWVAAACCSTPATAHRGGQ